MQAKTIRIEGRVQGVFFRATAMKEAKHLELNGWCRNEIDGSVFIHVEGEGEKISQFVDWCNQGPELASVTQVSTEGATLEGFEDFVIQP